MDDPSPEAANGEGAKVWQGLDSGGLGQVRTGVCWSMHRVHAPSPRAQNQQGDHMSEPSAAPVAAPASMPIASGAPAL